MYLLFVTKIYKYFNGNFYITNVGFGVAYFYLFNLEAYTKYTLLPYNACY